MTPSMVTRREPAVVSQLIALAGLMLAELLDVIALEGGAWAAVAAAVLAAAGVTRQRVTPVDRG